MSSDKLKSLIIAGALSSDPRYREAAQAMTDEERHMLTAHALGVRETQREQMRQLARSIGPRTTLPNHDVWPAVWGVMLANIKRGDEAIPENLILFARAIWREMYYCDPPIGVTNGELALIGASSRFTNPLVDMAAFLSLVDAVKR